MLIEFSTNASDLHHACIRFAAKVSENADEDKSVQFRVTSGKLGIRFEAAATALPASVRAIGAASVPVTILAGMIHVLPYFGDAEVEIGLSPGKLKIDTTVFHNRNIVVSNEPNPERRRSTFRDRALQPA